MSRMFEEMQKGLRFEKLSLTYEQKDNIANSVLILLQTQKLSDPYFDILDSALAALTQPLSSQQMAIAKAKLKSNIDSLMSGSSNAENEESMPFGCLFYRNPLIETSRLINKLSPDIVFEKNKHVLQINVCLLLRKVLRHLEKNIVLEAIDEIDLAPGI